MRVAYVLNTYPAASHTFIRREIQALESQGVQVERIAVRGWNAQLVDPKDVAERSATHYLLGHGVLGLLAPALRAAARHPLRLMRAAVEALRMSRLSEKGLLIHLVYLAEACRLLEITRRLEITHMHAHFGTNPAEVAMLTRMLGGPGYSFTVHGPEEFDKPLALHLREKIERSSFVVAISSFCRSQLFRWLPHGAWTKVQVVHCGVDQDFHAGDCSPPPASARLVCVGRLCEQKGQLLLLDAARRLADRGLDFELVLAGDGELRETLEQRIDSYGLRERIRITGWLSSAEVRAEMLAARALVLPSFAEGLPVVLMEAMALGRPVLTTTVAGIPELVENGQHGWLIPPGDGAALVEALAEILALPQGRLAEMGSAARERVLRRHCVDESARRLVGMFRQVQP